MKTMLIALLATSVMAQAQTSSVSASSTQQSGESSAKIQDLQKKDEQMKDIDQEITNAKLRAEMGSKSRWSFRSTLDYRGGTVQKAFDERRPNITNGNNLDARARMAADLAVKYRTSDNTSLNAGTGMTIITPFHRTFSEATNTNTRNAPASKRAKLASVSNPYLEFNYGGKLGSIQSFTQVSGIYASEDFDRNTVGTTGSLSVAEQAIVEVGNSSIGIAAAYGYNLYKDAGNTYLDMNSQTGMLEAQDREEQSFYAVPFYEYAFNDKYNFRTVFNWCNFSKTRADNTFRWQVPQQSMGLGISVTRDVFLYPNIQFIPQNIIPSRTNVALTANINLF